MLEKRNLTEFYSQVVTINEMFKTIVNTNNQLEAEFIQNNPPLPDATAEELSIVLEPAQEYVMRHIRAKDISKAVKKLFGYMNKHDFQDISSVPRNIKTSLGENVFSSTYSIYDNVSLSRHTLNCVVCGIELTDNEPQTIREIVILLCLLHDFGKHPTVIKEFGTVEQRHEHVSAAFSRNFLSNCKLSDVLVDVVYNTLMMHHTKMQLADTEKNKDFIAPTLYLPYLIEADKKARDCEEAFAKMSAK